VTMRASRAAMSTTLVPMSAVFVTSDSERVIKFPVTSTASSVIITGSESYPNAVVVPEFGSIAMMIMMVSIIVVIVSARKFQK